MYRNNPEEAQDNNYNNPGYNAGYMENPCLDCPYLRQYPEYFNPMMYPNDEYPVYDDMFRRRHRRRRRPFFHDGGFFPWWFFFF